MAYLEEQLHVGALADPDGVDGYPAVLVVATSAAGLWLVRRLRNSARIGTRASWALQCVYASKLAMLLLPEVRLIACGFAGAQAPCNAAAVSPNATFSRT